MKPYLKESGKRVIELMKHNKSRNYLKGKFNASRNRHKKALKTRVRQSIKQMCRVEFDDFLNAE
jgi:hypothetical protein